METTSALKFARIDRHDWDNLVYRGLYPEAPPTHQGKSRVFNSHDLAALVVLGQLLERDVVASVAGAIACEVRRQLEANPRIDLLSAWKVADSSNKPRIIVAKRAPTPKAIELFRFDILAIRAEIIDLEADARRPKSKP
jgi:hypothetical protein